MSSLQQDPSGNFHICFRFRGKRFKRSLKTKRANQADTALSKLDERLWLISNGHLQVPETADLGRFLIHGEIQPFPIATDSNTCFKTHSLQQLFDEYFLAVSNGSLDESTLGTLKIHRRHLERIVGANTKLNELSPSRIQKYINTRAKSKGKFGRPLCGSTIKKELVTLRTAWNWALAMELIDMKLKLIKLRYPKSHELLPFQTYDQIEQQIARGNCSEIEQRELWESLFLVKEEIHEALETIRTHATARFLHPMIATAAFTGARRSELLRMKASDVFKDQILLRERKRVRGEFSTRLVPIAPILKPTLTDWLNDRPSGEMLFVNSFGKAISKDSAHKRLKTSLKTSKWKCIKGFHVFRHSFISALAIEGVDQRIIDEMVGHSTEQQRQRYRHLTPQVTSNAVASVFFIR